jgi:hypothetical protein
MSRLAPAWVIVSGLLVAGCGGSEHWAKAGADEATAARAYRDCQELAGAAVSTDADIDQDIVATRSTELQRSGVVGNETQVMRETTRERAASVVAACMQAKGFVEQR